MPDRQIFFDPQRTRWKRLRRILDVTAVASTLVLAGFIFNVLRGQPLPELLLPNPEAQLSCSPENRPRSARYRPSSARRKTDRKPSDIPFNTDEGLRAAYYIPTMRPATRHSRSTFIRSTCCSRSGSTSMRPQLDLQGTTPTASNFPSFRTALSTIPTKTTRSSASFSRPKKTPRSSPTSTTSMRTPRSWDPAMGDVLKDPAKRTRSCGTNCALLHCIPELSRPLARF